MSNKRLDSNLGTKHAIGAICVLVIATIAMIQMFSGISSHKTVIFSFPRKQFRAEGRIRLNFVNDYCVNIEDRANGRIMGGAYTVHEDGNVTVKVEGRDVTYKFNNGTLTLSGDKGDLQFMPDSARFCGTLD